MMEISEEVLRALGRVTANFQAAESQIAAMLIGHLIPCEPQIGILVTSLLPFGKLCDLCVALFRHRHKDPALIEELSQIIKKISALEQRRNALIHSLWTETFLQDPDTAFRLKLSIDRKTGVRVSMEDVSADGVNAVADRMQEVVTEVLSLRRKL